MALDLYDALIFDNRPPVLHNTFKSVEIFYGAQYLTTGEDINDGPNETSMRKIVQNLLLQPDGKPDLISGDAELWSAVTEANHRIFYDNTFRWMADEYGTGLHGSYSGQLGFLHGLSWDGTTEQQDAIRATHDAIFANGDSGSTLNCWTFRDYLDEDDDTPGWDRWLAQQDWLAAEMTRLQPAWPKIVYLQPQFTGNSAASGTYVSAARWREMLDKCATLFDGAILWGGYQQDFDPSAGYWQATLDFLADQQETLKVKHDFRIRSIEDAVTIGPSPIYTFNTSARAYSDSTGVVKVAGHNWMAHNASRRDWEYPLNGSTAIEKPGPQFYSTPGNTGTITQVLSALQMEGPAQYACHMVAATQRPYLGINIGGTNTAPMTLLASTDYTFAIYIEDITSYTAGRNVITTASISPGFTWGVRTWDSMVAGEWNFITFTTGTDVDGSLRWGLGVDTTETGDVTFSHEMILEGTHTSIDEFISGDMLSGVGNVWQKSRPRLGSHVYV